MKNFIRIFAVGMIAISCTLTSCKKSNEALIKDYHELGTEIVAAANEGDAEKIATLSERGQKLAKELDTREFTPEEKAQIVNITSEISEAVLSVSGVNYNMGEMSDKMSSTAEESEEEPSYRPPFTVEAEYFDDGTSGYGSGDYKSRIIYKVEVKKNGTFVLNLRRERNNPNTNFEWKLDGEREITGKWAVVYRTMGEDSQKVYDLRYTNGETFAYLPDDLEYGWFSNTENNAQWSDCSNLRMSTASKITILNN